MPSIMRGKIISLERKLGTSCEIWASHRAVDEVPKVLGCYIRLLISSKYPVSLAESYSPVI